MHRLDKDTTGLLVVAKTDKAHAGLAQQFAAHGADGRLERRYRALVVGRAGSAARSNRRGARPQQRQPHQDRRRQRGGGPARRHPLRGARDLRRGETKPIASLLRAALETGRTHQIRVHLAHIGHPLLGDMTYGAGFKASARNLSAEAQAALEALGRQALHAGVLAFVHPVTGKRLRFASPLPTDMARLAAALGEKRRSGAGRDPAATSLARRSRSASSLTLDRPTLHLQIGAAHAADQVAHITKFKAPAPIGR